METICLQCGDAGYDNALVYCVRCLKYVVHRYCLDEIPETFDEFVPWLCDDCGEMERKQFLAERLNSTGCVGYGTKENVEVVAGRSAGEDSYNELDENERCRENSSQQPEEEKAEEVIVSQDSNSSDKISLKDMFKMKKRKRAKMEDLLQKENMHKKRKKRLLRKKLNKQSSQERAKLDANKRADMEPCDSDVDAGKSKFPSVSRSNGSLERSKKKKRIVTSAGAIAKEQMCRISSPQSLQGLKVQKQDATKSNKKHSESIEKKTSAPYNRSNSWVDYPTESTSSSPEPVGLPVWRGSFDIRNKKRNFLEGIVAHWSGKGCEAKVSESTSQLEPVLHLEKLLKSDVWPKRFKKKAPTNDMALYFFPTNIRGSERDFDTLVNEMIQEDLALKASSHNKELLIFPSTELPLLYWRIQGKHYLWGVFRGE